ncbi:DNA polymerase III subunit delta' [Terrarubrum flagellatum]|uniref:DNA polymerase III subunit delta' n=1 Tax=Terrirubrum flagellatum TaxID=2895980 RepID=UPI003144EFD9
MSDIVEPDQLEGFPHPRERADLAGHVEAERIFLDAYRSGRLHHAWIIGGEEGIGKATLAYRIARFLLANPDPTAPAVRQARDLAVDPSHPAARKVMALSHPDLVTLRRTVNPETKRPRQDIPIDMVRRATAVFASTAGEGGWRVCIVDSAEDLNRAGANALLKTLEEPPNRAIFLIVSHAPGRLLPTIRSRCRRLDLAPLSQADLSRVLHEIAFEEEPSAVRAAVAGAQGSVRRAILLLDSDLAGMGARTIALLDKLPDLPQRALLDLAGKAAGRDGEPLYHELLDATRNWLSDQLAARASAGAARVAPLAEMWDKLNEGSRTIDAFNIDRRPFIIGLFSDMAEAMARVRA